MPENSNTGLFMGLLALGVAAFALFAGGGSSNTRPTREQVMSDFRPSLLEELEQAATSATSSSSSTSTSDVVEHVERTGLLPSGNDVAARVGLINQDDFQEDYEPGDGAVGL